MVPLRGIWPLRSQVNFKYVYSKLMCHMLYHINFWALYSFTADKLWTKSHGISTEQKVLRSNGVVVVTLNAQAELQLLWKWRRTVTERSALPTVGQQNEGFRPSGQSPTKWAPPYNCKPASTYGIRCTNRNLQNENYKNSSLH